MKESQHYADLLSALYRTTRGTPIGGLLVETVAAVKRHGEMSARIGINGDKSVSVFVSDLEKGRIVAKLLSQSADTACHLYDQTDVSVEQFDRWLADPEMRKMLGGEADAAVIVEHWPRLAALAFLSSLARELAATDVAMSQALRAELVDPGCALTEARFRNLLLQVVGYRGAQLDQAVDQVLENPLREMAIGKPGVLEENEQLRGIIREMVEQVPPSRWPAGLIDKASALVHAVRAQEVKGK